MFAFDLVFGWCLVAVFAFVWILLVCCDLLVLLRVVTVVTRLICLFCCCAVLFAILVCCVYCFDFGVFGCCLFGLFSLFGVFV